MGGGESPLALSAEEMRALGYRTIDLLVDRLTGDPGPVVRAESPDELRARLGGPVRRLGREPRSARVRPRGVQRRDDLSLLPIRRIRRSRVRRALGFSPE